MCSSKTRTEKKNPYGKNRSETLCILCSLMNCWIDTVGRYGDHQNKANGRHINRFLRKFLCIFEKKLLFDRSLVSFKKKHTARK